MKTDMATKRMFSKDIVGSDAFQDMPASSQLLYFHLGMEADDDGFIGNPKKIARSIGMAEDDMKILVAKRFVLLFESGVLVIKHHRINNNWDKYNCKRTMYLEEFNQLYLKENKAYTRDKTQGTPLQSENSLKTVYRIEEKRIEENRKEESKESCTTNTQADLKETLLEMKTDDFINGIKVFLAGKSLSKDQAEEIRGFASYWTEPNKSKTKLRWELEKTWDLGRRLARWMSNKSFGSKQPRVTKV